MKRSRDDNFLERAANAARVFKTICDSLGMEVVKDDVFALMKSVDIAAQPEEVMSESESKTPAAEIHKDGCVIYVLELEDGKYYVGRSESDEGVDARIEIHKQQGSGSAWTKKYKFVREVCRKRNCSAFDEDIVTLQYMQEKGLPNVRGGSYCSEALQDYQKRSIKDQLCTATGCCFKCAKTGHFAKDCNGQ